MTTTRTRSVLLALIPLTLFVGLWALITWGFDVPTYLFARPWDLVDRLSTFHEPIVTRSWHTALGAAGGLGIGGGLAFALACLVCDRRLLADAFLPLAIAANSVPLLVFAPMSVLIFGFGQKSVIAVVAVVCFFPVFSNTLIGLRALNPGALDVLQSLSASPRSILLRARIPTAIPYTFAALRTAAAVSISAALVAEYFGAGQAGIGDWLLLRLRQLDLAGAFAALLVITVFGCVFYGLVVVIERVVAPWQASMRSAGDPDR